jgi:hypothetical protein
MERTHVERRFLIDYLYKNIKGHNFVYEKEYNYFSLTFWRKTERFTLIQALLSFSQVYKKINVRKKVITVRYNSKSKIPSLNEVSRFLSFIIPIKDIELFWLFMGGRRKEEWFIEYKRHKRRGFYSFNIPFPLKSTKLRFFFRLNTTPRLFESYSIPRARLLRRRLKRTIRNRVKYRKTRGFYTKGRFKRLAVRRKRNNLIKKGYRVETLFRKIQFQNRLYTVEALRLKKRLMLKKRLR